MKLLSAYTIARYCTDTTDVLFGIDEIREKVNQRRKADKAVPYYFYIRLSKLKKKLQKIMIKNSKKGTTMNYRCKELKEMIDRYQATNSVNELIDSLNNHIAEYGRIYDVAGISKADFAEYGYDTAAIDDAMVEHIARKIDLGGSVYYAIEYWAREYGIPEIGNED